MSLVKATLLPELDFTMNLIKWFSIKKENHHQNATSDYSAKVRQIIKDHLKRKQKEALDSVKPSEHACINPPTGLVLIRLGDNQNDLEPEQKEPIAKLTGICIDRKSFPKAREQDKVFLIPLTDDNPPVEDTKKRMIFGGVTAIGSSQIKIKFKSPLTLDIIDETQSKEKGQEEKEKSDTEINKLCEEYCNKDSDEDESKSDEKEPEQKDNESDDKSGGSDIEPVELDSAIGKTEASSGGLIDRTGCQKKAESESNNKDVSDVGPGEKVAVKQKVKAANYGIRLEPAENDDLFAYINCLENALSKFEKQSCSATLHKCLLGCYSNHSDTITPKSRVVPIAELPCPKYQQEIAIEQSIRRRISLIEGPAGSGKTVVAAHIACNVARVKDYKVLVCSPLQSTVNKLSGLLDKVSSVAIVKLPPDQKLKANAARSNVSSQIIAKSSKTNSRKRHANIDELEEPSRARQLDKLVDDEIYWESWHKMKVAYRNDHELMHEYAQRQVNSCSTWRRSKIEQKIINQANIVCCTNAQAGCSLLENTSFDMLILDDVQLVSEIDCLIPLMTKGLKQVTLISDMRRQIRLFRVNHSARQSNTSMASSRVTKSPATVAQSLESVDPNKEQKKQTDNPTTKANGGYTFTLTSAERKKAIEAKRIASIRRQRRARSSSSLQANSQLVLTSGVSSGPSKELGGLFERWLSIGLPAVDLRHQYRMHETLSSFTNYHYYLSRSKNDNSNNEKLDNSIMKNLMIMDESFSWLPRKDCLTAIYKVESNQINNRLDDLIDNLVRDNVMGSRIGVIFNRNQEDPEGAWVSRSAKHAVKSGTIEEFLGSERDFIILVAGCCDVEEASQLAEVADCSLIERNFMLDDCTLNIALTRARLSLLIITDDKEPDSEPAMVKVDSEASTSSAPDQSVMQQISSRDHYCISWRKLTDYYKTNNLIN